MSTNLILSDTAFRSDRRRICYTIPLSLCVHALAYYLLLQLGGLIQHREPHDSSLTLRIQIVESAERTDKTTAIQSLGEIVVKSTKRRSPTPIKPSYTGEQIITKQPLRIDSESVRSALREPSETQQRASGLSQNSAVVINPKLLETLNQAVRRTGAVASENYASNPATYNAGSWIDYVRFGDACFTVVRGNPFEPLSHEMWYRVKCAG